MGYNHQKKKMKKFLSFSLIVFLMGITMSSCESNGATKQVAAEVPELLVDIMGLSMDDANKKVLEQGYVKIGEEYIKGEQIIIGFKTDDIVQSAWGGVNTGSDLTNAAFLWLNSAEVMGFELIEGYIEYESGSNGKAFYKLSELKNAMKKMKGGWEMFALLNNSKKGVMMEYECDNEALGVDVFLK